MNFSINELTAILKVAAASGIEPKALSRLVSIEILKQLGDNRYAVNVNGKELQANSEQPLPEKGRYWAQLSMPAGKTPLINSLIAKPQLLQSMAALPMRFEPEQLALLLKGSSSINSFKADLLEQLAMAGSKEEFNALTQLTLSLHHNVLTLPLFYERYFGFFQMKKRYNKKNQKQSVTFYAALHHLGPVEGTLSLVEDGIALTLGVQFQSTLAYLEKHVNQLPASMHTTLQLNDTVSPLWVPTDSLLDVSI